MKKAPIQFFTIPQIASVAKALVAIAATAARLKPSPFKTSAHAEVMNG
jgi:hypothetical protein